MGTVGANAERFQDAEQNDVHIFGKFDFEPARY